MTRTTQILHSTNMIFWVNKIHYLFQQSPNITAVRYVCHILHKHSINIADMKFVSHPNSRRTGPRTHWHHIQIWSILTFNNNNKIMFIDFPLIEDSGRNERRRKKNQWTQKQKGMWKWAQKSNIPMWNYWVGEMRHSKEGGHVSTTISLCG